MIVVDTSVWIDYFRKSNPELKQKLDHLILSDHVLMPIMVKLEIFTGLSKINFTKIKNHMDAFPEIRPTDKTWHNVTDAIQTATQHGKRFSVADLTIAVLATENNARVWSLDGDFKEMSKLKLVSLFF
jgi:hypothetical protein